MFIESGIRSEQQWLSIPHTNTLPTGYFRSKLYVSSYVINPLIAAAGPLFSFLERLSLSESLPPIELIRSNIEHELYAFHSKLSILNYASEFTKIANYMICATIDELLGKSYLRKQSKIDEFQAFTPPSNDEHGPEFRFFDIVDHIKQSASQYLDLIELAYHCLITGFEGFHHQQADGRQKLDNLIEELYQLIKQHRVNKPYRLSREETAHLINLPKTNTFIMPIIVTASVIAFTYLSSLLLLNHQAKEILLEHPLLMVADY